MESDGAYFGGRKNSGKNNERLSEAFQAKTVVLGALERSGNMRADVVQNMQAKTVRDFIERNVQRAGTKLLTDRGKAYQTVGRKYDHHSVDHHIGEYVRGYVHVNSLENFWSHSKRSITGIHKSISRKHAQSYLNAFVFHYNNRHNDRKRFLTLLDVVLHAARERKTAASSSKQYTSSEEFLSRSVN